MSIEIMIVTIVIACIISPIILAVTISKLNKIINTQKKRLILPIPMELLLKSKIK